MTTKSVLIVDDNEGDRYILKRLISRGLASASVTEANDGIQALELIPAMEPAPSVILLDVNMPRMNGFEFLERYEAACASASLEPAQVYILISSGDPGGHRRTARRFPSIGGFITKHPRSHAELLEEMDAGLE